MITKILILFTILALILIYFSDKNEKYKTIGRILLLPIIIFLFYNYYPFIIYFIGIYNTKLY